MVAASLGSGVTLAGGPITMTISPRGGVAKCCASASSVSATPSSRSQRLGQRRERRRQARAAFVQDDARIDPGKAGYRPVACLRLGGQKADEQKSVGRQARHRQRRDGGAWSGDAGDAVARGAGFAHQSITGIRNQRRARITHQRHGLIRHARDNRGAGCCIAMVIVADQRAFDAQQRQQLASDTGIFARHDVGGGERRLRARRYIAEVADRGRDDVKTG